MNAQPDYPHAVWMPAHATNYRKAGRGGYDKIVIHCTDGRGDPRRVAEMWQEAGHGSSAHFVIGQDGTVIQCVRLADIAWHAHSANARSVGIEHCARTPGELGPTDPGLKPTPAQLRASAELVAWLCARQDLAPDRKTILGHAEVDPDTTHSRCPEGAGISLDAYVGLVAAVRANAFT